MCYCRNTRCIKEGRHHLSLDYKKCKKTSKEGEGGGVEWQKMLVLNVGRRKRITEDWVLLPGARASVWRFLESSGGGGGGGGLGSCHQSRSVSEEKEKLLGSLRGVPPQCVMGGGGGSRGRGEPRESSCSSGRSHHLGPRSSVGRALHLSWASHWLILLFIYTVHLQWGHALVLKAVGGKLLLMHKVSAAWAFPVSFYSILWVFLGFRAFWRIKQEAETSLVRVGGARRRVLPPRSRLRLCVNRIIQKLLHWFPWSFVKGLGNYIKKKPWEFAADLHVLWFLR